MRQSPTPPQTPTTHGPKCKGAIAPRRLHDTPVRENVGSEPPGYVSGASVLNLAVASTMPTPSPPTIPPPPVPTEVSPTVRENAPASPRRVTLLVSAQCGVKFALEPSGLTSQIHTNGRLEMGGEVLMSASMGDQDQP